MGQICLGSSIMVVSLTLFVGGVFWGTLLRASALAASSAMSLYWMPVCDLTLHIPVYRLLCILFLMRLEMAVSWAAWGFRRRRWGVRIILLVSCMEHRLSV